MSLSLCCHLRFQRRFHFPGRKPLDYHAKILTGILFVLKTGIAWAGSPGGTGLRLRQDLRREYLKRWHEAGVPWTQLHAVRCSPNSTRLTRSTGDGPSDRRLLRQGPRGRR